MMLTNGIEHGDVDRHDEAQADGAASGVDSSPGALVAAAARFREAVHILRSESTGRLAVAFGDRPETYGAYSVVASLPPVYPEWLGSSEFVETHGVRFPYVSGAMAHGIASPRLVLAMARAELLAFYGSAGVALPDVEANVVGDPAASSTASGRAGARI